MQGICVQFLVQEDFTCHEVIKPESLQVTTAESVGHNFWSLQALEAILCNTRRHLHEKAAHVTASVQQGRPSTAENKQTKKSFKKGIKNQLTDQRESLLCHLMTSMCPRGKCLIYLLFGFPILIDVMVTETLCRTVRISKYTRCLASGPGMYRLSVKGLLYYQRFTLFRDGSYTLPLRLRGFPVSFDWNSMGWKT